jgi:hypothetical protein
MPVGVVALGTLLHNDKAFLLFMPSWDLNVLVLHL